LSHHGGVILDSPFGITQRAAHLSRVPELFMSGPTMSDRATPLALARRMSHADLAEADHLHRGRLGHRHAVTGGIDDPSWLELVRTPAAAGECGERRGEAALRVGGGKIQPGIVVGRAVACVCRSASGPGQDHPESACSGAGAYEGAPGRNQSALVP
jgi:hypothetical protein